jgi:AcrR family transcriptional regulator
MTEATMPTKGEHTQQTILEAAERLILSQGYHGTSMRQIAAEAGIAVGGIYNHFASKEAIFRALLERHQPYSDIAAIVANLSGESAAELAERAARLVVAELLEDPVFFQLAMIDLQESEGDILMQFVQEMMPALLTFVQRIYASGQVRQDLPLQVLMRSFAGMVIFYALSEIVVFRNDLPWFQLPFSDEIDWIGGMVEIFLNGVLKREDS